MSILVSIVVPTYRRSQLLERCLQALIMQTFPPQAYEIIVVDDGPEDPATRALVREWQQRLHASYSYVLPPVMNAIPVTGRGNGHPKTEVTYEFKADDSYHPRIHYLPANMTNGPAAARNLGWRSARGEIIAFTDDDCIPEPDWLSNGVSAFVNGVAGVSGRVIVPLPPEPTDYELNTIGLERSDFITANCFYRRKVLEKVGGFDERFTAAWREDSDLYFTIREHNYPLAWASGAIVLHPVRPERWGSSLRAQRKSFFNALLYKKHPKLYWRLIQPSPPWHYYAMLAALVTGLVSLAAGQPLLAAAGLGVWFVLVAVFIYKRLKNTTRTPAHVLEMVVTSLAIPFLSIYWRLRGALHWGVLFF